MHNQIVKIMLYKFHQQVLIDLEYFKSKYAALNYNMVEKQPRPCLGCLLCKLVSKKR